MSGEILLLMLVFIVLPLIEQAIKNARQKRDDGAAPRRQGPPARPAPPRAPEPFDEDEDEEDEEPAWVARPPVPPPLPPTPPPAPRQAPRPAPAAHRAPPPARVVPPVPVEVLRAQRARLERLAVSASPELASGAARRQRRVRLPELRRPASLKRAIVLQAVLGPCRANDPHA